MWFVPVGPVVVSGVDGGLCTKSYVSGSQRELGSEYESPSRVEMQVVTPAE